MQSVTRFFRSWLVVATVSFVAIALLGWSLAWDRWRLVPCWESTTGEVVSVNSAKPPTIVVRYSVDGTRFDRVFLSPPETIGARVAVAYCPADPGFSSLENNPSKSFYDVLMLALLLSIAMGFSVSLSSLYASNGFWSPEAGGILRVPNPRLMCTVMSIAVVISSASQVVTSHGSWRQFIARGIVLTGTLIATHKAYAAPYRTSWGAFFANYTVVLGLSLVLVGLAVYWLLVKVGRSA